MSGLSLFVTPKRRPCLACLTEKTAASFSDRLAERCRKCVRDGNEITELLPVPKNRRLCAVCAVERPLYRFEKRDGYTAEVCTLCADSPEVHVTLQQIDAAAIAVSALRKIAAARLDGTEGMPTLGVTALQGLAQTALDAIREAAK